MSLNVLLALVIVVLLIAVGFLLWNINNKKKKTGKEPIQTIIISEISRINEIAAYQYTYHTILHYNDALPVKILKNIFRNAVDVVVIGTIKIGVNLKNLLIVETANNIEIVIPELIIISHDLEFGKEVIQKNNFFYSHNVKKYNDFIQNWKINQQNEILKNEEFINKAYIELKNRLITFLTVSRSIDIQKINISVQTPVLLPDSERLMEAN